MKNEQRHRIDALIDSVDFENNSLADIYTKILSLKKNHIVEINGWGRMDPQTIIYDDPQSPYLNTKEHLKKHLSLYLQYPVPQCVSDKFNDCFDMLELDYDSLKKNYIVYRFIDDRLCIVIVNIVKPVVSTMHYWWNYLTGKQNAKELSMEILSLDLVFIF